MPKKGGANKNNSLFNNNKSSFENNISTPIGNELNVKLSNKLNNNNLVGKINNKAPNTTNSVVSSKKGKYTTIIVIVVVFTILAILSYVAYRYINYKSINKVVTKEIIPFIYDSKKTSRYSYGSLPVSTERNSYNYNMWIYINDYDYRVGEDKCVLMKGYTANNDDQVNPGIYLLKNTNTLRVKITLETLYKYAECNNDAGISDTVKEALQDNNYYLGKRDFVKNTNIYKKDFTPFENVWTKIMLSENFRDKMIMKDKFDVEFNKLKSNKELSVKYKCSEETIRMTVFRTINNVTKNNEYNI